MYSHHTLDHEFEEGAETTASYVVCALPRSGSSLLCELLFGTGLAGAPAEYFDVALMRRLRERWGADGFDSYLDELLARRTGPNGVFGFKAHFFQIAEAFPERGVEQVFPALQYVYITRGDRLRQAISWSRALQTGKWASDHPARDAEPTYGRDQIDRLIAGIAERERRWEAFFEASGATPLRISYEELIGNTEETVRSVLRHLGEAPSPALKIGPATLQRQADALTESWIRRYLEGDPVAVS